MSDTIDVRVARRADEAQGVVSLRLERIDGAPLPAFEPGAHVDLHLGDGLVRQYSLCNVPGQPWYELGILLAEDSRGGSRAAHALREGDRLRIGAPRNLFPLASDAPHHLLLAGGIGITPLLSMAEVLHRDGRPFALHACARSSARLPFRARLATAPWTRQVRVHIDGPDGPSHRLDALVASAQAGSHVYACGPASFIEAARRACEAAGFGADRFHSESFSALPVDAPGNDGFEVEINDGRVFRVAADQSVAQCLEAHGVFIPVSCEQGICGTCVTRVRAGIPDHRDQFLTDEERSSAALFTPCCSRSLTPRLVLDLDA